MQGIAIQDFEWDHVFSLWSPLEDLLYRVMETGSASLHCAYCRLEETSSCHVAALYIAVRAECELSSLLLLA